MDKGGYGQASFTPLTYNGHAPVSTSALIDITHARTDFTEYPGQAQTFIFTGAGFNIDANGKLHGFVGSVDIYILYGTTEQIHSGKIVFNSPKVIDDWVGTATLDTYLAGGDTILGTAFREALVPGHLGNQTVICGLENDEIDIDKGTSFAGDKLAGGASTAPGSALAGETNILNIMSQIGPEQTYDFRTATSITDFNQINFGPTDGDKKAIFNWSQFGTGLISGSSYIEGYHAIGHPKSTLVIMDGATSTAKTINLGALKFGETWESIGNVVILDAHKTTAAVNALGAQVATSILTGSAADVVNGRAGNDDINTYGGDDTIAGGGGNDFIHGGLGRDVMAGGAGKDTFDFNYVSESSPSVRDFITDFVHLEDKLDLAGIDAKSTVTGDQAFTWLSTAAFAHHAGDLRFEKLDVLGTANDTTRVQGDVNGDAVADFEVTLKGLVTLSSSDFVL